MTPDFTLLEARKLSKHFAVRQGLIGLPTKVVRAVDQVNLTVKREETVGIVGESGCGKTTLARVLLRLTAPTQGQIMFEGKDIAQLEGQELRKCRLSMQMVFQNPYSSFDPRFSILRAVTEPLRTHTHLRGNELKQRAVELLDQVGMTGEILYRYPHEFSGGQLQRIAVARALALNPKLVVLDEPTSALDVSIQAQILNLLESLQEKLGLTYLLISHDLSVVQYICDNIAVMYLGKIIERSSADDIFLGNALHPYTKALIGSVPILDKKLQRERILLTGNVPDPANPPSGCCFHPRCRYVMDICSQVEPELIEIQENHLVACHLTTTSKEKN